MGKKPKCYSKCNECLFHFTKRCVALAGDDYFIKISAEQAYLIIMNQNRFEVTNKLTDELYHLFPELEN